MPSGGAFSFCSDFKFQHPRLALLGAVTAIVVGPLAYSHRHLFTLKATERPGKDNDHSDASSKKSPTSLPNLLPPGMSPTSFAKLIESGRNLCMKLDSHESTNGAANPKKDPKHPFNADNDAALTGGAEATPTGKDAQLIAFDEVKQENALLKEEDSNTAGNPFCCLCDDGTVFTVRNTAAGQGGCFGGACSSHGGLDWGFDMKGSGVSCTAELVKAKLAEEKRKKREKEEKRRKKAKKEAEARQQQRTPEEDYIAR